MKTKMLALLLFAAPAHAATWTYNFSIEDSMSQVCSVGEAQGYPCDPVWLTGGGGGITEDGITAHFSSNISYARMGGYQPMCGLEGIFWLEQCGPTFKNSPSMSTAAYFCTDLQQPPNPNNQPSYCILFDPPIRYFKFSYSGSVTHRLYWCDGSYVTHDGPLTGTPKVKLVNGFTVHATVDLPTQGGTFYESGCDGDPDHAQCEWTTVEIVSQTACNRVVFDLTRTGLPLLMDNMVAATGTCSHPPCEFERASAAREESAPIAPRRSWGSVKAIYR